jgi:hypothetical protein
MIDKIFLKTKSVYNALKSDLKAGKNPTLKGKKKFISTKSGYQTQLNFIFKKEKILKCF